MQKQQEKRSAMLGIAAKAASLTNPRISKRK
jgi:hypothetical protein